MAAVIEANRLDLDKAIARCEISHLYNHLVRYTDRKVRTAARLEAPIGAWKVEDQPSLGSLLPGDSGLQPLTILIQREEQARERTEADVPDSMVRGYVRLLGKFHTMRAVANHLLISVSHAYRCRNRALRIAHIHTSSTRSRCTMRL